MRMLSRVLVAAMALALLTGPVAPAGAWHQDLKDGDDSRGQLDVRVVRSWGRHMRPGWKVISRHWFTVRESWDTGYVVLFLDTFGTTRRDYFIVVRSTGRGFVGHVFRDYKSWDKRLFNVRAWKERQIDVAFRVPLSRLRFPDSRSRYRWWFRTMWLAGACSRGCIDAVPNKGVVVTRVR